jgi:hypothetical protein
MPETTAPAATAPGANSVVRPPASSGMYPWYDSMWLEAYVCARRTMRTHRPALLADFENAMAVFRTPPGFKVKTFDPLLDDATLAEVRRAVQQVDPRSVEVHEAAVFRRLVVHDLPFFTELQHRLTERVSEAAGEAVEPRYNFLSLYSATGVCQVHMDAPLAKWTLDLCLNQSEPWPIHFSQVLDWPGIDPDADPQAWARPDWAERITASPDLNFESHAMLPGQAILFSGSSQWHYRDAMPNMRPGSFCDLLFLHYIPLGTARLVNPMNWAEIFGLPELGQALQWYETGALRPVTA